MGVSTGVYKCVPSVIYFHSTIIIYIVAPRLFSLPVISIFALTCVFLITVTTLTDIKGGCVVSVARARVSRFENEAGDAGVLDNVTPTGIGDVVCRA